jgi:hypothetical protein
MIHMQILIILGKAHANNSNFQTFLGEEYTQILNLAIGGGPCKNSNFRNSSDEAHLRNLKIPRSLGEIHFKFTKL